MERLEREKVGNCLGQRTLRRYLNANHDIYECNNTPRIVELACEMMGALVQGGGGGESGTESQHNSVIRYHQRNSTNNMSHTSTTG